MFRGFFNSKQPKLTKIETWNKFELFELFADLDQAGQILSKINGGYSGAFSTAEEFYKDFVDELYDLKHQNVPCFHDICNWFAPTSAWDSFVGIDGIELGNRIYERANKWNKANC